MLLESLNLLFPKPKYVLEILIWYDNILNMSIEALEALLLRQEETNLRCTQTRQATFICPEGGRTFARTIIIPSDDINVSLTEADCLFHPGEHQASRIDKPLVT